MRASQLIQITGARLTKRGRKRVLKVAPRFTDFARSHKSLLVRAIRHPDEDLDLIAATSPERLHDLGFAYDSALGWVCNLGTEIGERIILGLLPPHEHAAPLAPPIVDIEATKVRPGVFRWTEPKGARVRVFSEGRRLA